MHHLNCDRVGIEAVWVARQAITERFDDVDCSVFDWQAISTNAMELVQGDCPVLVSLARGRVGRRRVQLTGHHPYPLGGGVEQARPQDTGVLLLLADGKRLDDDSGTLAS